MNLNRDKDNFNKIQFFLELKLFSFKKPFSKFYKIRKTILCNDFKMFRSIHVRISYPIRFTFVVRQSASELRLFLPKACFFSRHRFCLHISRTRAAPLELDLLYVLQYRYTSISFMFPRISQNLIYFVCNHA